MHGRLRVKTSKEQEEEQKIKDKLHAEHFQDLKNKLFAMRPTLKDADDLSEFYKYCNELLLINPDFYTAWNMRKENLLRLIDKDKQLAETELKEELLFIMQCLKKNEKSYSAWQHRIWCLSKLPKSEYDSEIMLCNSFLMKDERNFHCWDYRSYISDIMNANIESELEFTTEKIRSNFSNFSAWHRRHKLFIKGLALPENQCPRSCNLRQVWNEEYDMILSALFTDPADQSPWLYHNWLIRNNFGNLNQDHVDKLKSLEELEPDNRWVKQALQLATSHLEHK